MNTPMKSNTARLPWVALPSLAACIVLLLSGCMTAGQHQAAVRDDTTDRLTAGKVQREIHVGMSGGQVSEVLGSPNIVTTDENRREVWIYDKIATEVTYSKSEGGLSALIFGGGGSVAGGLGGSGSQAAGASSSSQRTLTVVIKFDENKLVRDFAYHQTAF
jgi:outer membrane protein assembly factor BamE (lipoprotein component of BamABCDE complex)